MLPPANRPAAAVPKPNPTTGVVAPAGTAKNILILGVDSRLGENSQFQVKAVVHNADVTSLQHAAGTDYPVSGTLNFSLQASGTLADPRGHGQVSLTEGEAHGRTVKTFTSKIIFADHQAQLEDIRLLAAHGSVSGTAAYNFHNYGKTVIGNRTDVERVPITNLAVFYQKYYQPDNAELIVAGQFDDDGLAHAERYKARAGVATDEADDRRRSVGGQQARRYGEP